MTSIPTVSIIMPAFNAASTIGESIESVKAQSLKDWELIIVDDGSSDRTAAVAQAYARADARICVIERCNRGPSVARNAGAELARGDVLAFLDADDLWAPERLHGLCVKLADTPRAGIVFSRTRFVDAVTGRSGTLTPFRASLSASDIMAENALCSTSNIVCRRRVFLDSGGFRAGLNFAEDQDWLLRIALEDAWQIVGVDEEWFFYRSDPNSQSGDLEAMRRGWFRLVETACREYPKNAPAIVRQAYGPIHRQLARRALRSRQPQSAIRYLFAGVRRDPALFIREPKRTILTLVGTLLFFIPIPKLKELVAR